MSEGEKKNSNAIIYLIMGVIIIILLGLNVLQFTRGVGKTVDTEDMVSIEQCSENAAAEVKQLNSDYEKYIKEYEKVCNEAIAKTQKGKPTTAPKTLTIVKPPAKDFFADREVEGEDMIAHKKRMQEILNEMSQPVLDAQAKTQEESK